MKAVAAKDLVGKELFEIFTLDDKKYIAPMFYIYRNESDNYYEFNEYTDDLFPLEEFISQIAEDSSLIECGLSEATVVRTDKLEDIDQFFEDIAVTGELSYFDITPDTPCGYYITH